MSQLVLLSGWGIDARIWQLLAPCWPPGIKVRTPDWPGYGVRANETAPTTLPELANAMRPDLPADATWVGWSLGGLLAGTLLTHLPAPHALVLLGCGTRFCSEDGVTPTGLATFRRAFERDPLATWQYFLRWQLQDEPAPRTAYQRLRVLLGQTPSATHATLITGLDQLAQLDLAVLLTTSPCPIYRFAGERDKLIGQQARQHADLLLADSGHCPMLTHPDALTNQLRILQQENYA